jgi:hypothetical protein
VISKITLPGCANTTVKSRVAVIGGGGRAPLMMAAKKSAPASSRAADPAIAGSDYS